MLKKRLIVCIVLIMMLVLTGCWDAIEIDDRGYVMSIGIDKYTMPSPEEEEGEEEDEEEEEEEDQEDQEEDAVEASSHFPEDSPRNRYSFTYMIPNVEFLIGESDNANIIYNTVGENLYSASRILTTRINKQVFFGHMKVVVIGEEVARDPKLFRETLDAFERDPFIGRRVSIAIAPGEARSVLEVEPQINPMTGDFIADLFRNKDRSPRSGGGIIGNVLQDLHQWGNAVIPRIIAGEEDVKVAGSAIIKNYQMVGWLGEIETRSLEIIRGTSRPGGLSIRHVDQEKGEEHIVPVDLVYLGSQFHLEDEDDMKIRIEITAEGEIQQFFFDPDINLLEPEIIREIEDLVCEKVKEEVQFTIQKLQEEFQVDVLGIDDYLSKYHPNIWMEIEEDWVEIFSKLHIEVDVDTKIRRVGLTK